MAANKFVGLRRLVISRLKTPASGSNPAVYDTSTIIGKNIGSDGMDLQSDPIEMTIESYAGDETHPIGTQLKKSTFNLIPYSVSDMGQMLPGGWDPTTGTWNLFQENCNESDVTIAWEKVCPNADGTHGANVLLRHVDLSLAHNAQMKRNSAFVLQLGLYPSWQPGSEYGLTGANGAKAMAWQYYDGTYDGTTDTVTYDPVPTP